MKHLPYLLLLLAFGCADTAGKGEEDALPEDGKADSFRRPTEHGNLPFGVEATATLGEDERFHAWEFSLEGDASLDIEVGSDNPNLDTVAYLYMRENDDENWGRYIARNDDASDSVLTSRISGERGGGQYRLIVKGFKQAHVGPFTVTAQCSGQCGGTPIGIVLPETTAYGEDCGYLIQEVFRAPDFDASGFNVLLADIPSLDANLRVAVGLYELAFGDEFEDFEVDSLDVGVQRADTGEIISVEIPGADEATVYYVFDASGFLLMHYWSNQSPDVEFYCDPEGESTDFGPEAECFSSLLFYDGDEPTTASYSYIVGEENDLPPLVNAAAEYFAFTILEDQDVEEFSLEVEMTNGITRVVTSELTYGSAEIWVGEDHIVFSSYENDDIAVSTPCERLPR